MMASKRILRLDEETINRIAAGEIVQRPAAVVKELIENSLDAGSTSISVTCKGGGLDFLQIQDNGHGIPKNSLDIVCERFTTSKITKFEDLDTVSTFGFRGEALASITHVAHVTITTMTAGQKCAYKTKYLDGKLVPVRLGDKADPKPCAGVVGTIILVEDLFYNMATRRQAFKSPQEEFQRILDVMTKHAVHFPHVSFLCKKADKGGSNVASLQSKQNATTLDNIRLIYGSAVVKELLDIEAECSPKGLANPEKTTDTASFLVSGYISNANYSCKKSTFVVFINNRLVTCLAIQRCVEAVYKQYLPKHTHPFVYLSITMPPQHIDVNVHPTKKEVHFLFEVELLGLLHDSLTKKLEGANDSRVFLTQSLLTAPSLQLTPSHTQAGDVNYTPRLTVNSSSKESSVSLASVDAKTDYQSMHTDTVTATNTASTTATLSKSISSTSSERREINTGSASKKRLLSGGGGGGVVAANKFVRTDPSLQPIDRFFAKVNTRNDAASGQGGEGEGEAAVYCMMCSGVSSAAVADSDSDGGVLKGSDDEAVSCCCCSTPAGVMPLPPGRTGESIASPVDRSNAMTGKLVQYQLTSYDYASLLSLLKDIDSENDVHLQRLLRRHTLVGIVDDVFFLVQSGTQLILVDHSVLTYHMFRQLALRRFGEMPIVALAHPVDVKKFIVHALGEDGQWDPSQGDETEKEIVAEALCSLLSTKGDMLKEYFRIGFTTDLGVLYLVAVPELLTGYRPSPAALPLFLLRLGVEVDWERERECFEGVSRELALCYSALPCASGGGAEDKRNGDGRVEGGVTRGQKAVSDDVRQLCAAARSMLLETLLPALKAHVSPPQGLSADGSFVVVAALEQLYKVFERC